VFVLFLATHALAVQFIKRKRNIVPAQYYSDNRDDKISNIKTKIIKLESNNKTKKMAIEALTTEIGIDIINLSDSDIDDEQELVDQGPIVDGRILVGYSPQNNQVDQFIGMPTASNPETVSNLALATTSSVTSSSSAPDPSNTFEKNLSDGDSVDTLAGPLYSFKQNVSIFNFCFS
jgi:hypothetical protein